jgi:hypothetical protein
VLFWDELGDGRYFASLVGGTRILRLKNGHDGAESSANISLLQHLVLGILTHVTAEVFIGHEPLPEGVTIGPAAVHGSHASAGTSCSHTS